MKKYYLQLISFDIESSFFKFRIYVENEINHLFNYDGDLFVKYNKLFDLSDLNELNNVNIPYLIEKINCNLKDYYIDLNKIYSEPLRLHVDSIENYIKYLNNELITSNIYKNEKQKAIYYFDFIINEFKFNKKGFDS